MDIRQRLVDLEQRVDRLERRRSTSEMRVGPPAPAMIYKPIKLTAADKRKLTAMAKKLKRKR